MVVQEWANVQRVRNNGVPIIGFTWYSLTDQVDWDSSLRKNNACVNALDLYDLDRKICADGIAYRELTHTKMEVLPAQDGIGMGKHGAGRSVRPACSMRANKSGPLVKMSCSDFSHFLINRNKGKDWGYS